jgi:hypothetical protein
MLRFVFVVLELIGDLRAYVRQMCDSSAVFKGPKGNYSLHFLNYQYFITSLYVIVYMMLIQKIIYRIYNC